MKHVRNGGNKMIDNNDQKNLPDPNQPQGKRLKFSYFEPIMGIIITLLASIIFLGFPHIITVVFIGGPTIPTFNADVIRSLWIPIILWALFRIGVEAAYLYERKYTKRLAKISIIGHALTTICSFIILISPRIVNQDYISFIHDYYRNVSVWFGNILARPNLIILVIIMIIIILESINVIRKGNKAEKREEEKKQKEAKNADEAANKADDPSAAQEEKVKKAKFSYFEPFKGIIFAVIVTVIFLAFPQIISFVFLDRLIPTFYTEVIRSLWIPIIIWALLRIGIKVAYLIEQSYTKRLAIITAVGNILAIICGFVIFVNPRIVNQEYINFIHRYFEDLASWFSVLLTGILDRPNLIILVLMIVILIVESLNVYRRSIKKEDEEEGYVVKKVKLEAIDLETEAGDIETKTEDTKTGI